MSRKNRLHRPHIVVPSTIPGGQRKQRTKHVLVDGKKVCGPDRYEAEAFRDAVEFRVFGRDGNAKVEIIGVAREQVKEFLDKGCLIYAVTQSKRSACVTQRTLKVYEALFGGADGSNG